MPAPLIGWGPGHEGQLYSISEEEDVRLSPQPDHFTSLPDAPLLHILQLAFENDPWARKDLPLVCWRFWQLSLTLSPILIPNTVHSVKQLTRKLEVVRGVTYLKFEPGKPVTLSEEGAFDSNLAARGIGERYKHFRLLRRSYGGGESLSRSTSSTDVKGSDTKQSFMVGSVLSDVNTADYGLAECARLCGTSLTALDLSRTYHGSAEGLAVLALGCSNLQVLKLNHCYWLSGQGTLAGLMELGAHCRKLLALELAGIWTVKCSSQVVGTSKRAGTLDKTGETSRTRQAKGREDSESQLGQELNEDAEQAGCGLSLDSVLATVAAVAPLLQRLVLRGNAELTNLGLLFISKLQQLRCLDISFSEGWTGEGLQELIQSCTKLEELDISGPALTDWDLQSLGGKEPSAHPEEYVKVPGTSLTRLRVSHLGVHVSGRGLAAIGSLASLTDLDLNAATSLDDSTLGQIFRTCPLLCTLSLLDCNELTGSSFIAGAPRLQLLKLRSVGLTEEGLISIPGSCPQLVQAYLDNKGGWGRANSQVNDRHRTTPAKEALSDASLQPFSACEKLRRLELCGGAVSGTFLSSGSSFSQLRELRLLSGVAGSSVLAAAAQGCPSLEVLEVPSGGVSDTGVVALRACKRLRCLKLDAQGLRETAESSARLTGTGFGTTNSGIILQAATESLTLEQRDLTSVDGIVHFPSLENLSLSSPWLSDEGLAAIAQGCPSVKDLSITLQSRGSLGGAERGVTDKGVANLARCRLLSKLELSGCLGVRGVAFRGTGTAGGEFNMLRELVVSLGGVDDEGLGALAGCCPRLRAVILHGCWRMTKEGVTFLARHCRSLENIQATDFAGEALDSSQVASALGCQQGFKSLRHYRDELELAPLPRTPPGAMTAKSWLGWLTGKGKGTESWKRQK